MKCANIFEGVRTWRPTLVHDRSRQLLAQRDQIAFIHHSQEHFVDLAVWLVSMRVCDKELLQGGSGCSPFLKLLPRQPSSSILLYCQYQYNNFISIVSCSFAYKVEKKKPYLLDRLTLRYSRLCLQPLQLAFILDTSSFFRTVSTSSKQKNVFDDRMNNFVLNDIKFMNVSFMRSPKQNI